MLGVTLLGSGLIAGTAEAGKAGFDRSYNPEPGLNTYSTNEVLSPSCPSALAATPGSDPAEKILNPAPGLNTPASFAAGGTVHFIYRDNPHPNPGQRNFTIQDCVVTYPVGFFPAGAFDPTTGLVNPGVNFSKSDYTKGGTQIDGAALSGISQSTGDIFYSWTAPGTLPVNTGFVCFFARDIRNNHGGGGNRKVPPLCYQVTTGGGPGPQVDKPPAIWLGYADTYRASSGAVEQFLPSPWQGAPGVKYVGCTVNTTPCGAIDAGAIRIDNPSGNTGSLTLVSAEVNIGSCKFNPWTGTLLPVTAAGGETIILTQTGELGPPAPSPCNQTLGPPYNLQSNFDTSEAPVFSCTPTVPGGYIPVITLNFSDGSAMTIDDTNQILNTKGTDSAACTTGIEYQDWKQIQ